MNILLCVCGGVSAYKSLWFMRLLKKEYHKVRVILTQRAQQFVTSVSVEALIGEKPYTKLWQDQSNVESDFQNEHQSKNNLDSQQLKDNNERIMLHIELAKWSECIIIVPATANRMAQITQGIADDLLNNVMLAKTCPVAIAPSMNKEMWANKATQANTQILRDRGFSIWGPNLGEQACGDIGVGRLLEPEELLTQFKQWINPKVSPFKHVLITGGATREYIDPVRFLTNRSSGQMSVELAKFFSKTSAKVTLILGSINDSVRVKIPDSVKQINIETADQMYQAVQDNLLEDQLFISCAAISDYKIKNQSTQKIKKQSSFSLELISTIDIVASVAALKNKPFTVGFALETQNLIENATKKLLNKNLDVIIANSSETLDSKLAESHILWQDKQGNIQKNSYPKTNKEIQASNISNSIQGIYTDLKQVNQTKVKCT